MTTCSCPACGSAIDGARVLVDHTTGMATHMGRSMRFTPDELRYVEFLVKNWPNTAVRDRMYDAVYGHRLEQDRPEMKIIDVMICKMRDRLDALGLVVTTLWGIGYQLQLAEPLAAEALRNEALARRWHRSSNWGEMDDEQLRLLVGQGLGLQGCAATMRKSYSQTQKAMLRLNLLRMPVLTIPRMEKTA